MPMILFESILKKFFTNPVRNNLKYCLRVILYNRIFFKGICFILVSDYNKKNLRLLSLCYKLIKEYTYLLGPTENFALVIFFD